MKPGMRMLMLSGRNRERDRDDGRMERRDDLRGYSDTRGNYSGRGNRPDYTRNEYENEMRDMEARFRGGERHYSDYRDMTEPEIRRRDRRGRFTSEMEPDMGYVPYIPPVYEKEGDRMNMIGFERRDEIPTHYGMRADHHRMDEMEHRSAPMQKGRGIHENRMTREMAEEWMMGIQNEDGTKGPHWSMDQARQVMQQRGIEADPATFWAVLNMMYSDYCKVFKKHGVGDRVDFYADMASAWMNDKDGPEPAKKTAAYYMYVVNQ